MIEYASRVNLQTKCKLTEYQSFLLRLLNGYFVLVGSAMFGATFNLVTRVGLPYFLEHWKIWKLIVYHLILKITGFSQKTQNWSWKFMLRFVFDCFCFCFQFCFVLFLTNCHYCFELCTIVKVTNASVSSRTLWQSKLTESHHEFT